MVGGPESGDPPVVLACGLGPAGPEYLNEAVLAATRGVPVFLRTARHLAAAPFLEAGAVALDGAYEAASSFEEAYRSIVEELVAAARGAGRVAYCLPGSPVVLERTVTLLRSDPRVRVEIVANVSFLDLAWAKLGVDPVSASVRLVDGERFALDAAGERGPLLVAQLWSRALLSDLKVAPQEAPEVEVVLLHHLGHQDERVLTLAWEELDRGLQPDHLTCLYIPELAVPVARELVRAEEVVRVLRERCPWDMAQTHQSLVRHLVEETYETIEAIDGLGEPPRLERAEALEEELGDVLCQVLFHSRLAAEEGLFSLADVARTLTDKLVRRHPHVFSEEAPSAEVVLAGWEQSKLEEKGRESVMDGIPPGLPALLLAEKIEKKAVAIGLSVAGLVGELDLEVALRQLENNEADEELVGELLLAVAARCVESGIEAEGALRRAAATLRARVVRAELAASTSGTSFALLPAEERRRLFLEAEKA
jgi:tetrapyrrole methylase family protein/MazG family protein